MKKSTRDVDDQRKEYRPNRPSKLFLLRVWMEKKDGSLGPEDVAGKVQDPISGAVRYFNGGLELVRILHCIISRNEVSGPTDETNPL